MSIFDLLTVIFVVCKIAGVAPIACWSWWLVLAPTLIPVGFFLTLALFALIISVF